MRTSIKIGAITLGSLVIVGGIFGAVRHVEGNHSFFTAQQWIEQGAKEFDAGKFDDANKSFTRAVELDAKTSADVFFLRGATHYLLQEWTESQNDFLRAKSSAKDNQEYVMWWTMSRLRQGARFSESDLEGLDKNSWPGPVTAFLLTGNSSQMETMMANSSNLEEEKRNAAMCTMGFAAFAFAQAKVPAQDLAKNLEGAEKALTFCEASKPIEAVIMRREIQKLKAR